MQPGVGQSRSAKTGNPGTPRSSHDIGGSTGRSMQPGVGQSRSTNTGNPGAPRSSQGIGSSRGT
eukprot:3663253-Pleurochrysis_carterae.AAC.1